MSDSSMSMSSYLKIIDDGLEQLQENINEEKQLFDTVNLKMRVRGPSFIPANRYTLEILKKLIRNVGIMWENWRENTENIDLYINRNEEYILAFETSRAKIARFHPIFLSICTLLSETFQVSVISYSIADKLFRSLCIGEDKSDLLM